jgi:hypothetical protein
MAGGRLRTLGAADRRREKKATEKRDERLFALALSRKVSIT